MSVEIQDARFNTEWIPKAAFIKVTEMGTKIYQIALRKDKRRLEIQVVGSKVPSRVILDVDDLLEALSELGK